MKEKEKRQKRECCTRAPTRRDYYGLGVTEHPPGQNQVPGDRTNLGWRQGNIGARASEGIRCEGPEQT